MKWLPQLRLLFLLLTPGMLIVCAQGQHAQITLPFTKYTVANGLAQMQVRSIYIDKDGPIWIGTQGGMSVYDGNDMRTINNLGPLSGKYIVNLTRGSEHLYISTHTSQYAFSGNDIIPLQNQKHSDNNTFVEFVDGNRTVWYQNVHKGWVIKDIEGNFNSPEIVYPHLKGINIQGAWGSPEKKLCYILDDNNRFYVYNLTSNELSIDSVTLNPEDNIKYTGNHNLDLTNILIKRWNKSHQKVIDIYKISGDRLVHVAHRKNEQEKLRAISPQAPYGYVDRHHGVNHIFILLDSVYKPEVVPQFNGIRFAVESFHKLFVATDEGFIVIHCDGLENMIYPQCDYAWSVVPGPEDQLLLGCYKSGIHRLDKNGKQIKQYQLPAFRNPTGTGDQILTNYLITSGHFLWGSNGGFIALKHHGNKLEHIGVNSSIESFAVDLENGSIIAGGSHLEWFANDLAARTDSMSLSAELLDGAFVNDMLMTNDRKLFIAAPGGIMRLDLNDNTKREFNLRENTLPCNGAVAIEIDDNGTIWSGGTCGLMALSKNNTSFQAILPDIINNRVNQISIIPGQRLVCASNNNLYVLDVSKEEPDILYIYDQKNGLNLYEPSENGSSVTQGRYVWMPSVQGIQRLDLLRIPQQETPVKLVVISLNGSPVRSFSRATDTLITDGHAALLELSRIDHSGKTWQYQYSLNGSHFSPWQDAKEFLVSGLQHGNNQAHFRASWNISDPDSYVGTNVVIKTNLPFLNRNDVQWASILLTILLLVLIVIAVLRGQRILHREQKLKAELYRNRLKTIQAYLNPHFLFNTLTSIQDRILHHDASTGNDLIIRLARVFRKVLDTGKSADKSIPMIRLSEEMDLINDMVYLNNAQLHNPIQVLTEIDHSVKDMDPLIPPLMIQPFVENAFKHAFDDETKNKSITVQISKEDDNLIIQIRDNGKGYAASQPARDNSSMGSFLANERMELLNQLRIENHIAITNENPHGTLVEIKIQLPK